MRTIRDVSIASDGIVVVFDDRSICYYEAGMLFDRKEELAVQTFISHDPSLCTMAKLPVQPKRKG
ncbi:hypothetical protein [Granulicella arctica]|uniref:hypothetical protein n=1 Tax=Granulicella arctica TaxID=940613 RepID=UPI0021DF5BC1|nr:hypothetical protein [Granulicella arctica]